MHVFTSFLKWGSIGYSLGIVQWDFTRRDHSGNPRRVSKSGLVTQAVTPRPERVYDMCNRRIVYVHQGLP